MNNKRNQTEFVDKIPINILTGQVDSLIFEDFPELIGFTYETTREAAIPTSVPGAVIIRHSGRKKTYHVFSCIPLYSSLTNWIFNPQDKIAESSWQSYKASRKSIPECLWFSLRRMADIQHNIYTDKYHKKKINEKDLLIKIKDIITGFHRDVAKLNKKYNVYLKQSLPFQKYWLEREKVLKGKLKPKPIEVFVKEPFICISINQKYFWNGKEYSDLTIPLFAKQFFKDINNGKENIEDFIQNPYTIVFQNLGTELDGVALLRYYALNNAISPIYIDGCGGWAVIRDIAQ